MTKKVFLLFFAVLVFLATSCSKDETAQTPPGQTPQGTATPEAQSSPDTTKYDEQESFSLDGVLGDDSIVLDDFPEDYTVPGDSTDISPDENLAIKPSLPPAPEMSLDDEEYAQSLSTEILEIPENGDIVSLDDTPLFVDPNPEDTDGALADSVLIEPDLTPKAPQGELEMILSQPDPPQPIPPQPTPPQPAPKSMVVVDLVDPVNYWNSEGTFWDAVFVGSKQVGFQSNEFSSQKIQGLPVKQVVVKNQVNTSQFDHPLEFAAVHSSFETLDGDLIGCQSKIKNGQIMFEQNAKVIGQHLELETKLAENSAKQVIPWQSLRKQNGNIGGCCTIQISLYKQPLQDREERRLSFFDPNRQSVVNAVLAAQGIESVDVWGKTYALQRIDAVLQSRLDRVPCVFWTDRIGSIIKMSTPFLENETLTTLRSTKKQIENFAIASSLIGIERMPVIPLSSIIVDPNAMDEIVYLVTIKGDLTPHVDPSAIFPNSANQKVLSVGRNTVRITVRSQVGHVPALEQSNNRGSVEMPVTNHSLYTRFDLEPNFWANSDNPAIVQLSNEAVNSVGTLLSEASLSSWDKATALERWVFDHTKWKSNSGFLTASEVAQLREADSMGYGILLTALARAQKIPARIAVGLIYTSEYSPNAEDSQRQGLAFHLWNEMLIDNQWIPFDATFGLGGASAARIKVADSDLESTSFVSVASEVLRLAGNLDVEIDSASMKQSE